MVSTCTRYLRRVRKHIARLTSPKFWNAVLHNRCHAWFGGLARKSVILMYAFYEMLACAAIGYFYYKLRQAAKLSLVPMMTDYKFFSLAMFFRGCFGCVGVAAACRRKIRTMRFYFFTLPASVLCAGIVAGPFVNMRCECSNYAQCGMTIAFKSDKLLNIFPDPADRRNFMDPPKSKPPKSVDNVDRIVSSAPVVHRRLQNDSTFLMNLYSEQVSSNTTLVNRSTRRFAKQRRHSIFKFLRRRLGQDNGFADAVLPGGKTIRQLRKEKCTCQDKIRLKGHGHARQSCKFYWKQPGVISSWCPVDPLSVRQCEDDKIVLNEVEDEELKAAGHKRFWTEDLCVREHKAIHSGGCTCSEIGMELNSAFEMEVKSKFQVLSDENATLGSKCDYWRYQDAQQWCFVGFDSNCSDRAEYVVFETLKRVGHVDKVEQVSQFRSSIPCHDEFMSESMSWCRLWRNTFCLILIPLTFGPVPMAVIIYLFLRNRCGDLATFRAQFNVDLSSSSSEDDFDIVEERSEPGEQRKKGRKSKASSRCSEGSFDVNAGNNQALSSFSGASKKDNRKSRISKRDKSFADKSFNWAASHATRNSSSEEEDGTANRRGKKMRQSETSEEGLELAEVAASRPGRRVDDDEDDD